MTSTTVIKRVLERDHHVCVIRGPYCTVHATVADHRANRGHGGSPVLDDMANLIASCVLCNSFKEDADNEDRRRLLFRGIRVPKRATNAQTLELARDIPVLYPDGVRRLLLSDGRFEIVSELHALEVLQVFGINWKAVA